MLTKYIIKQIGYCIYSHKPIDTSPVVKAWKMYNSENGGG